MAWLAEFALLSVALIGHFAITVWLFNRLHALAMPRTLLKALERSLLLVSAALLLLVVASWWRWGSGPRWISQPASFGELLWTAYSVATWLAAAVSVPIWLLPKLVAPPCPALISNDTAVIDVAARLGFQPVHGVQARWLMKVPGNQLLQVAVQQKTVRLRMLPEPLSGLTIAHLSDLHMTGEIGEEYYQAVVGETNALNPDLILITGDILEKERCFGWVPSTFGRLKSRLGTYFILGNHEYRLPDPQRLRQLLEDQGLIDLGSRCEVMSVGGCRLLLAGNERPWFGKFPEVPPRSTNHAEFRMLLSHTPDQLEWARSHDFDLMVAGHNHGGQIRLPYLGALITPSLYGYRYAGGLFHEPPTLLHVSRGLGGIHPIRLNCPPELALLELQPG